MGISPGLVIVPLRHKSVTPTNSARNAKTKASRGEENPQAWGWSGGGTAWPGKKGKETLGSTQPGSLQDDVGSLKPPPPFSLGFCPGFPPCCPCFSSLHPNMVTTECTYEST